MLLASEIKQHLESTLEKLAIKGFKDRAIVEKVVELDDRRKSQKHSLDEVLAQQNKASKEIGDLFRQGKQEEANAKKEQVSRLKDEGKDLEDQLRQTEADLFDHLVRIPNLPHESVPAGQSSEDNEIVFQVDQVPVLDRDAKPHWELASQHDLIDFELGNKITGSGFPVYKGKGAKLQRALINFFLDHAIKEGYQEVIPPLMVNEDTGFGTGQLPDKEGMMYHVGSDNFYLIPTAEVPVTNIFRDEILKESDFPILQTAYTPCFRREAGSYGKDVRGLNRLHQFDKVEIVQIQHPDRSYETLDQMVKYVESLVKKLELPYRIVRLCGGDISFASALTFDFEVWSAAQEKWLEVSSVSNFESFQSSRLKLRFKDEHKKTRLAHTLNGSALALPRILAALLENNQTPQGIKIPEALVEYTGFSIIS